MSSGDSRRVAGWKRGLPWALCAVGLSLAGASGCANSDTDSRMAAKATVSAPEQVVQRIEPAPVAPVPSAPATSARPPSAAVASGAVASAAATPEAPRSASAPPVSAEPITSKHLEAELNRLEAELR